MSNKLIKKKYKNLPNYLTILRILLTPIIIVFIFLQPKKCLIYELNFSFGQKNVCAKIYLFFLLAAIFFVIAILTDFLDGYLARKNNLISNFGKIWDPIADKILINSILIIFAIKTYIPFYLALISIARDIIVDGYKAYAASCNIIVGANIWGKIKTFLQMLGLIIIFFLLPIKEKENNPIIYYLFQNFFLFLATSATTISGLIYAINITKCITTKNGKN